MQKKRFGSKRDVSPGCLVFPRNKSKAGFHNFTYHSKHNASYTRSHAGSTGLYLLQLATLSKRERATDLFSGDTTTLRDRGPGFCLVVDSVRQGGERARKTGSKRTEVIPKHRMQWRSRESDCIMNPAAQGLPTFLPGRVYASHHYTKSSWGERLHW